MPTQPRPRKTGSGPRPPALRIGDSGRESAKPQKTLTEARLAPPGCSCAAPTVHKARSEESALWG